MQSRILDDRDGRRLFAVILETNEEFPGRLLEFARERDVTSGWLTGLGAFANATVSFWDPASKEYLEVRIDEQVEVLSLVGNMTMMPDRSQRIHAHVALGDREGRSRGGHLMKGRVHPTLEIVLTETGPMKRKVDEITGLPLIRFDHEEP